jgi:hypothetical protein
MVCTMAFGAKHLRLGSEQAGYIMSISFEICYLTKRTIEVELKQPGYEERLLESPTDLSI